MTTQKAFDVETLTKILSYSPKLYRRELQNVVADGSLDGATARAVLVEDLTSWGFNVSGAGDLKSRLLLPYGRLPPLKQGLFWSLTS